MSALAPLAFLLTLATACGTAHSALKSQDGSGLAGSTASVEDMALPAYAGSEEPRASQGVFADRAALAQAPAAPTAQSPAVASDAPSAEAPARYLVYRADVSLAVFQARASLEKVDRLARDLGGYLVSRTDETITIRVPADAFRKALGDIEALGDVLNKNVDVQDVTDQFLDLEVRLKNALAVRERLAELIARAQNVEDALAVERELARVTGEIESMKGQIKRLQELIAYSTITVHFQVPSPEPMSQGVRLPFPWFERLGLSRLLELQP